MHVIISQLHVGSSWPLHS